MREFINRYGVVVISVCLVIAAIIYFFFGRSSNIGGNPAHAYYIDEITGEESVQPSDSVPPLLNKDGKPTLVFVLKISCDNGKNPRVAYYRKYTPEAQAKIKELMAQHDPAHDDEIQDVRTKGEWIRLPDPGSPWVPSMGEDGDKIRQKMQEMCKPGQVEIAVCPP